LLTGARGFIEIFMVYAFFINTNSSLMRLLIVFILVIVSSNLKSQIYLDPTETIDNRVTDLVSRMSLDEKIGQMAQVELKSIDETKSIIADYYLGSVLTGGGLYLDTNSVASYALWYDSVQFYAMQTPHKIPVLYGVDAVHGHNNVNQAVLFPHNIGLGCTRDTNLVQEISRITALEVKATGMNWNFAPCVAVPQDERWGRTYEGYSENVDLVTSFGAAAIRGYQGDTLSNEKSVLACAKHFIADGGTYNGVNMGNAIMEEEELRRVHLPPYIKAVDEGVGSVMASFSSWNNIKCHGNQYLLTDVLKTELGFDGFVISDWGGVDQVANDYKTALKQAINAGVDMIMLPYDYDDFSVKMKELIASDDIPMSRVDDAVSRILKQKFRMGLFENHSRVTEFADSVGIAVHRTVAREAVRKSVVLLENNFEALPLDKNATITVIGKNANNLGYQCGGWSILWQGASGKITEGTTILDGMKEVAPTANITYSIDGSNIPSSSIGVVVIGETPYAESNGDSKTINFSQEDVAAIRNAYNSCEKVICVIVSGRPLILDQIAPYAHAIVAAWLPGTEGQGVADVLFGDYLPSGELSFTWPKSVQQLPINYGDSDYEPMYEYGYGLKNFDGPVVGSAPKIISSVMSPNGAAIILTTNKDISGDISIHDFECKVNEEVTQIKNISYIDAHTIKLDLNINIIDKAEVSVIYTGTTILATDNGILAPFSTTVYNWLTTASRLKIPGTLQAESSFFKYNSLNVQTDGEDAVTAIQIQDKSSIYSYVKVSSAGDYMALLRFASEQNAEVIINVYSKTNMQMFSKTITSGSISEWKTDTIEGISLDKGEYIVEVTGTKGLLLLDYIKMEFVPTTQIPFLQNELDVYPNPVDKILTISNSEVIVKVSLINVSGVVCLQEECNSTTVKLSVENLKPSVYKAIVKLENGKEIQRSVIIE